jgi:hypothetical protein
MLRFSLFSLIFAFLLFGIACAYAEQQVGNAVSSLELRILSSKTLNGTAGDYVSIEAQITNLSGHPINDIATYLSLVDMGNKLPVDLEDWSAERGLYVGTIDSGQTFPLNWKIHFVKPGDYSLMVVAIASGDEVPQVSGITRFNVQPKRNLNPGQVLPVALGMPVLLALVLLLFGYRRLRTARE